MNNNVGETFSVGEGGKTQASSRFSPSFGFLLMVFNLGMMLMG